MRVERAGGARLRPFVVVGRRLLVLTAALSLCASATALASHSPSPSTRAAIVNVIRNDREVGNPRDYLVEGIRVSSRGPYARASTVPRDRAVSYQGQLVLLRHNHGGWRVIDFGTAGVGCALPSAVQRDLGVTPPASFCAESLNHH